jgi:protein required for attachment to host cells
MSDILLHHGDWVVVCDGAKALIFENNGHEIEKHFA